jgi:hypothetical protein
MLISSIFAAAAAAQRHLDNADIRSCVIGGLALQRWGQTRLTTNVDFTLVTLKGEEERVVETLVRLFKPRFPGAMEHALHHRVYLASGEHDVPLDFSLGALDLEIRTIERATRFDFGEAQLTTCSAEDQVVYKTFAARGQDWVDVEGILLRQLGKLNWDQILAELRPLADLKEAPQLVDRLIELRDHLA